LIVIYEPYSLPLWPYILFAIIFIIEILGPLISKSITFFKMRDEYSNLPVLSSLPIISNKRLKRIIENAVIIISFLLFIILIKPILIFINNSNISSNMNIIKCSFEITGFIFLVLFLVFRISSSFNKQFLDSLERRIIMEELNAEEIKTIFIKEFVGDTVRNWIDEVESKRKSLFDNYASAIDKAYKEFDEIKDIDKKYPI